MLPCWPCRRVPTNTSWAAKTVASEVFQRLGIRKFATLVDESYLPLWFARQVLGNILDARVNIDTDIFGVPFFDAYGAPPPSV